MEAGWQPSPDGAPVERWWNGATWTDHTRQSVRLDPHQLEQITHSLQLIRLYTGFVALMTLLGAVGAAIAYGS